MFFIILNRRHRFLFIQLIPLVLFCLQLMQFINIDHSWTEFMSQAQSIWEQFPFKFNINHIKAAGTTYSATLNYMAKYSKKNCLGQNEMRLLSWFTENAILLIPVIWNYLKKAVNEEYIEMSQDRVLCLLYLMNMLFDS